MFAIGRFEIERESASGGAGTVFRARDAESGSAVAVKVIRGVHHTDLRRFEREARILAQIRHPGVVRYIKHGVTDTGDAYLVMEWLDGEDLRDRLSRTGLTMAESVTLGLRVAEALAVIHGAGLIHRDIKPGNLFLPAGMVADVKIIDFGLARGGDGSMGPTQTGVVVGTPSYMSPEQARGQREVDARADLYSLGCVLFKCLTGKVPFPGKDLMAVLAKVLLDEAPRVGELCPRVPRSSKISWPASSRRTRPRGRRARPPSWRRSRRSGCWAGAKTTRSPVQSASRSPGSCSASGAWSRCSSSGPRATTRAPLRVPSRRRPPRRAPPPNPRPPRGMGAQPGGAPPPDPTRRATPSTRWSRSTAGTSSA